MVVTRYKKTTRAKSVLFAVLTLWACVQGGPAAGQSASGGPAAGEERKSKGRASEDSAQWQYLLDALAVEARMSTPEEGRPALLAEVADTYWDFDEAKAKELFRLAFEDALSLKPDSKQSSENLSRVISMAARRDPSLSVRLSERLAEYRSKNNATAGEALRVAREMLESDAGTAARIAEAGAALGPSMSAAWFIFQLSQKDAAAAEQVYRAYLNNLIVRRNFNLSSILWLAGYPFGHGEGYGGTTDPTQFPGFGGLRVRGLRPPPELAAAYLKLASEAILHTLRDAASSPEPERDMANSLAFFAVAYLAPEVERYQPDWKGRWSGLYQQALSGTSEVRRAGVQRRLQEVFTVRARAGQDETARAGDNAESKLEDIDKLTDQCQRDKAYAQAALRIGYEKDFSRALDVAVNIKRDPLRNSVLQFVYYDIVSEAIRKNDLDTALTYQDKVSVPGQRALLHVKMARQAHKKLDKSRAIELLYHAKNIADGETDARLQISVLLAAAEAYAPFDVSQAANVLQEAVKTFNRIEDQSADSFGLLRRINLGCREGDEQWYGGSDQTEKHSLSAALAAVAASDAQRALLIARSIDAPGMRVRAQLQVIRTGMKTERGARAPAARKSS